MTNIAFTLPAGWGYHPAMPVIPDTGNPADMLPELPMLKLLRPVDRNETIVQALIQIPRFREIRQRDVTQKYGIPDATAAAILQRARRYA